MFFDHPPSHLHADYAGEGARIGLNPIAVLESQLPPRALAMSLNGRLSTNKNCWTTGTGCTPDSHPSGCHP
ncbi:MAG: DUF4160 domain-containing protein [Candidatus Binatia bacterium]